MKRRSDYEKKLAKPGPGAELDIQFIEPDLVEVAEKRRAAILELEAAEKITAELVAGAAASLGLSTPQFNRYRRAFREKGTLTSLLPQRSNGGRGGLRLDPRVDVIIVEVRLEYDRDRPNALDHHAYKEIRRRCRANELAEPSFNTLRSRYANVPIRQRTERKFGKKLARERHSLLFGETPPTAFPLERIQIDHTMVDVVCTGVEDRDHVGRPWITIAIDEHTRSVLAFVLSWEYPNATTVALLITRIMTPKRDMLERLGSQVDWPMYGKPASIYVDNANEFSSRAVVFGCNQWNIPKPETRPGGMPHFGGIIERFMGTAMTQLRLLSGTTVHQRGFGKERTKNPNETAELSLPELELWMLEAICGQYHKQPHSGNGNQRPDLAWNRGIYGTEKRAGLGEPEVVKDKLKLFLDFAEINLRTIERYGVQLDKIRYQGDVLQPYLDAGDQRKFVIKRNPYDLSCVWFLRPEDGKYYELRTMVLTSSNVSLWEWKEHGRRLRELEDVADVEAQDRSIARQRELEKAASSATSRHRRRKNQERRSLAATVTAEIVGSYEGKPYVASPKAQPSYRRDVFFQVDDESLG
ncbi:Mu transposase C-terminal domain-containing protein [Caulobacter sp.]|uniref:Mu transposase C-terminal domain-containing protein n=1 Tax=Caulobacter sp. TaxID=78 RepID=UPI003BAD3E71